MIWALATMKQDLDLIKKINEDYNTRIGTILENFKVHGQSNFRDFTINLYRGIESICDLKNLN